MRTVREHTYSCVTAEDLRLSAKAVEGYDRLLSSGFGESTRERLAIEAENHDAAWQHGTRILRPWIITARTSDALTATTRRLAAGLDIAVQRLAADRRLRRAIGMPEYLEPLIGIDSMRDRPILGRFDGFIDETGTFRVIEYNVYPVVHGAFEINSAFAGTPIARAFAARFPFSWTNVLDRAHEAVVTNHRRSGKAGTPTVAVMGFAAGAGEEPEWRWVPYLAARGCIVATGVPEEFEYEGQRLRLRGRAVDLVLLANWRDLLVTPARMSHLLAAVRDGNVEVVNGMTHGLLASYKSTFEMLSDPQYQDLFPADVWSTLEACVPWTRVLGDRRVSVDGRHVDLLAYAAEHQKSLVLKPTGSSRGAGIVLGWVVSQDHWARMLARPAGTYVVQQRVVSNPMTFPVTSDDGVDQAELVIDCCPFVWRGGEPGGSLVRASPSGRLQNVAAGGMRTATWVLEPHS